MHYPLEKVLNEMVASCGSYVKYSDPSVLETKPTANNLTPYKSRTEFMLVSSRERLKTFNRLPSFTIDINFIKQAEVTKSLGV